MKLYLVIGPEALLRRRAVAAIRREVLKGGPEDLNLDLCDGETASPESVEQHLRMPPWGEGARLVIVQNADDFIVRHAGWVKKVGVDPHLGNVLVLVAPRLSSEKVPRDLGGEVIHCKAIDSSRLPAWLQNEAKGHGWVLDSDAAFLLTLSLMPSGEGVLDQALGALEVLALYAGGKTIRKQDVELFFGGDTGLSVFKWADAVFGGRLDEALGGVDRLLSQGEPPLRLIGLLERQVQILVELHPEGQREGGGPPRIPSFVLARYREQVQRLGAPERLWHLFEPLAAADFALKNLPLPPAAVLTKMILEIRK